MLRRIAAERLARVKQYIPVKTPILREIPIPATEIEHQTFSAAELFEGVLPTKLRDKLLSIPSFEWGKSYGKATGQWYRVGFQKALANPEVVAVGESPVH